jgi:hypothetical protein
MRAIEIDLPSLGSAHDHIDVSATALRANKPLVPVRDARLGTVPLYHFGGSSRGARG